MKFTVVELGGAELAAPMEKATAGPVEKAAAAPCTEKPTTGERHGGEGGRRAAVLWRGGDAVRQRGGAMDKEARWRTSLLRRRSEARSWKAVTALW